MFRYGNKKINRTSLKFKKMCALKDIVKNSVKWLRSNVNRVYLQLTRDLRNRE